MCNYSMNAVLFRCFACLPAAFLAVWGGQTERETPLQRDVEDAVPYEMVGGMCMPPTTGRRGRRPLQTTVFSTV